MTSGRQIVILKPDPKSSTGSAQPASLHMRKFLLFPFQSVPYSRLDIVLLLNGGFGVF